MRRRLLNILEVSEKLGFSRSTFDRKRADLEAAGMPKPTLGADQFGSERWDNRAIDLWLDSRIPPGLRARDMEQGKFTLTLNADNVAEKLQRRAEALRP
jgi:predicted DNA-binding transcriptional regulator AlpA